MSTPKQRLSSVIRIAAMSVLLLLVASVFLSVRSAEGQYGHNWGGRNWGVSDSRGSAVLAISSTSAVRLGRNWG